jgi:hypothetical protein
MKYLKVCWRHINPNEPSEIYCEVDSDGNEIRKVEKWTNKKIGYADKIEERGGTHRAKDKWPSLREINLNPEFQAIEISSEAFEDVWKKRVSPD